LYIVYLALTKIQSNYYRTNFFFVFISFYLHLYVLFANFAPQPDEETGSAEEQPASNMAVPTLEAVFQEPPRPWAAH
jgi:high-affinity K+ transport system ATPase subunit B